MLSTWSNEITTWQVEQRDALRIVRRHLAEMGSESLEKLRTMVAEYLAFRQELDLFLAAHFSQICTQSCYANRRSACCGKDGILTFFADGVINALISTKKELDRLEAVLEQPNKGFKCIYLGPKGCLWHLRPVVCALFLCDSAEADVFDSTPSLRSRWTTLKEREKLFKWPDRPVLFNDIEKLFITAGYSSPLMYCHNSPGLLRIKRSARR